MEVTPKASVVNEFLTNFIPSPTALQRHLANCKICQLPPDSRMELDNMLLNGSGPAEIIAAMRRYDIFLTTAQIEGHKKYLKYTCDEASLVEIISQLTDDEKQAVLREDDPVATFNYKQIQEAKDRELLYIWNTTLPTLRELIDASIGNAMLPVKDYATAYECVMKTAMLLEGKPTQRFAVEGDSNLTDTKSALDKLCEMVGVQHDKER